MDDPMVDRPPHYTFGAIEVIDAIEAWELGFHLGNVVKYVARAGRKGEAATDLKKARWYLDREINRLAAAMEVKQRTCLKCNQPFESDGPGNRICRPCGRINARIAITEEQLQKQRGVKRRNGDLMNEPLEDDLGGGVRSA